MKMDKKDYIYIYIAKNMYNTLNVCRILTSKRLVGKHFRK